MVRPSTELFVGVLMSLRGKLIAGDNPCTALSRALWESRPLFSGLMQHSDVAIILNICRAAGRSDLCEWGRAAGRNEILSVVDRAITRVKDRGVKDAELEAETKRWLEDH